MKTILCFCNLCIVFLMIFVACKGDVQALKSTTVKPTNIIVILDVSDRLEKNGQIDRDIKIVEYIVNRFKDEFVKKHLKKYMKTKPYPHRLTFAVPEQPVPVPEQSESEQPKPYRIPSGTMKKLKIRSSGEIVAMSEIKKQTDALKEDIKELYKYVQKDNPYTGADIWTWFHKDAENYLQKDFQNYIICLSDGYLKFTPEIEERLRPGEFMEIGKFREDPDWEKNITHLLSTGKDFQDHDVTFMMMEINLHRDKTTGRTFPQDFDIIKAHWEHWLKDMGITNFTFKQQVSDEVLEDVINSFLVPHEESQPNLH